MRNSFERKILLYGLIASFLFFIVSCGLPKEEGEKMEEYTFERLSVGANLESVEKHSYLTKDSRKIINIDERVKLSSMLDGSNIDLSNAYFEGAGELIIDKSASINGYYGSINVVVEAKGVVKLFRSVFEKDVVLKSDYSTLENCTVAGDVSVEGKNILVSCTDISGALEIVNSHNCSIIGNDVVGDVSVTDSSYITVAECDLSSLKPIKTSNAKNLLVNNNKVMTEKVIEELGASEKIYGSNIEVSHREEIGVTEELLAPVDNSRFLGMEKKNEVMVFDREMSISNYITYNYSEGHTIVIPPGVYFIPKTDSNHLDINGLRNYKILAYGVKFIFEDPTKTGIYFSECENVVIKGLTIDYLIPPITQGTVLEVEGGTIKVKIDDGYLDELDNTDLFAGFAGEFYKPNYDYSYAYVWFTHVVKEKDGTFTLSGSNKVQGKKGDKFIIAVNGAHSFFSVECSDMKFEDVTIYAASAFGFMESNGDKATTLNRIVITPGLKPEGATEERLKSTRDATHSTAMREGMKVYNTVFEKMTDDGANMSAMYSDIESFDTETKTIKYKNGTGLYNASVADFRTGDTAWIYTLDGKFLCEAKATSDTVDNSFTIDQTFDMPTDETVVVLQNSSRNSNGFIYENCLMQKQTPRAVLVKATDGVIRNCTFKKAGKAAILVYPEFTENWGECGFARNILIENNYIEANGYYNNVRYSGAVETRTLFSPITVITDAAPTDDIAYQNQKNIKIINNVIGDRYTENAIYMRGVDGAEITGNKLGIRAEKWFDEEQNELASSNDDTAPSISINGCTDILIKDNVYPKSVEEKASVDEFSKDITVE